MNIKALNDGTTGFRFSSGLATGIYRVRVSKKRYGITKGDTTRGFHFGKRSLYIERSQANRYFWDLAG